MGCWTLNDLNDKYGATQLKYGQSASIGSIQLPPNIKATSYFTNGNWNDICKYGTVVGEYDGGSLTNFPPINDKIPCAFKFEEVKQQ